jgi:hypothetical protein
MSDGIALLLGKKETVLVKLIYFIIGFPDFSRVKAGIALRQFRDQLRRAAFPEGRPESAANCITDGIERMDSSASDIEYYVLSVMFKKMDHICTVSHYNFALISI